ARNIAPDTDAIIPVHVADNTAATSAARGPEPAAIGNVRVVDGEAADASAGGVDREHRLALGFVARAAQHQACAVAGVGGRGGAEGGGGSEPTPLQQPAAAGGSGGGSGGGGGSGTGSSRRRNDRGPGRCGRRRWSPQQRAQGGDLGGMFGA